MQSSAKTYETIPNNNIDLLKIRIDTSAFLERYEDALKGLKNVVETDEATGQNFVVKKRVSEPLVNEKGFQALYTAAALRINPSTVQGNQTREIISQQIFEFDTALSSLVAEWGEEWGISEDQRELMTSNLVNLFENFVSRTLDDGERRSYGETMRHVESSRVENKGLFGGGSQ